MKTKLAALLVLIGLGLIGFGFGNFIMLAQQDMKQADVLAEDGDADMAAFLAGEARSRQNTGYIVVAVGVVAAGAGAVVWKKK